MKDLPYGVPDPLLRVGPMWIWGRCLLGSSLAPQLCGGGPVSVRGEGRRRSPFFYPFVKGSISGDEENMLVCLTFSVEKGYDASEGKIEPSPQIGGDVLRPHGVPAEL